MTPYNFYAHQVYCFLYSFYNSLTFSHKLRLVFYVSLFQEFRNVVCLDSSALKCPTAAKRKSGIERFKTNDDLLGASCDELCTLV